MSRRICPRATPCIALFCALSAACTTRLDPTLTLVAADAGEAGNCIATDSSGSRYWICSTLAFFDSAARDCSARGASLAQVSSAEENDFLALSASDIGTHSNLWIGGTSDDEHVWTWPDGTVFWIGLAAGSAPDGLYANWKAGEPNDSSTVVDESERCAALTLFDTQWNDRACSLELSYICELALATP